MIRTHPGRYFQTDIIARVFTCWTVAGTVVQQSLAQFFNSHWHDCSTVTGTIMQVWLAWFFNSHGQEFSFFYAGRILQQWCSLLTNRAMCQEYDTWFYFLPTNKDQKFLHIDSITLYVYSLPFPKHPKYQVCNIVVISQGKCEGRNQFLPVDKHQRVF